MEAIIIITILWIIPMYLNFRIAQHKNRNYLAWTMAAFFFGWLSTGLLALLGKRAEPVKFI